MSGIDLIGVVGMEARRNERAEQRKTRIQVIAIAVVVGIVVGIIAGLLSGCALMRPEACNRCHARPAVTGYKPHGDEMAEVRVCEECAAWMGRKIRRKAVR